MKDRAEGKHGYRHILIVAFILLLIAIPYAQVRHHEFVDLDDYNYIVENPKVKYGFSVEGLFWALGFRDQDRSYWRPLTWMTHMLDFELFGDDPGMHHLTNLLFHILNTILLYWLLYRLTGRFWPSAVVALLFAVHPINVESVAWVTERNNLLSTFLGLLTLIFYASYGQRPKRMTYYAALLAYLMCLMAKPILVTLPFLMLLIDYWPLGRWNFAITEKGNATERVVYRPKALPGSDDRRQLKCCIVEKVPFLVLAIGAILFSLFRFGSTIPTHSVPVELRISNAVVSYVKYLGHLIWPFDLAGFYPFPDAVPFSHLAGSLILLGLITLYGIWKIDKHPYILIGWLWFIGTLVPKIGLVQAGLWPELADRWAYFPAIGVFIGVVWWVSGLLSRDSAVLRTGLGLAFGIAICTLTAVSWVQVGFWSDSKALFQRMIDKTHNNYMAHNNLGFVFIKERQLDKAQEHFEKAIAIRPKFELAFLNLGSIAKERGKPEVALEWYQKALRINPRFARAYLNIGNIYFEKGAYEKAIGYFMAGLDIDPNGALLYNSLGAALTKVDQLENAAACFKAAIKIDPGLSIAVKNLEGVQQGLALRDKEKSIRDE